MVELGVVVAEMVRGTVNHHRGEVSSAAVPRTHEKLPNFVQRRARSGAASRRRPRPPPPGARVGRDPVRGAGVDVLRTGVQPAGDAACDPFFLKKESHAA